MSSSRNLQISRSSDCSTVASRIWCRPPESARERTVVSPPALTAMYTVPTGWPSCGSGPATPVVAAPTVAPRRLATPSAIALATSGCTAPWLSSSAAGTPSSTVLRPVAYGTTAPWKAADAPGIAVSDAASIPPVSDSATAIVSPRALSRSITSWDNALASLPDSMAPPMPPGRGGLLCRPAGRAGPAQPGRAGHVVRAGHHRHDQRGCHYQLAGDLERPGQDVQGDRDHLKQGLRLAAAAGRDDAVRYDPEPQAGHGQLAEQDDARHPPGQLAERRQHDQCRAGQRLVRDRIRDLAEVGDQAAPARQLTVEEVGRRGHAEGHAGRDPRGVPSGQQQHHEHRHQAQAGHGQRVRDIDQAWRRNAARPGPAILRSTGVRPTQCGPHQSPATRADHHLPTGRRLLPPPDRRPRRW